MATVALIFAGGVGKRMTSASCPKQFMTIKGKPIIIHTLEKFSGCSSVDSIVVVCLAGYEQKLGQLIRQYRIEKVSSIISGGASGQESIYKGLREIRRKFDGEPLVLIHDGVRPFIDQKTIEANISCAQRNGNAITVARAIETVAIVGQNKDIEDVYDRNKCVMAKAPQTFYLNDILFVHEKAIQEGYKDAVDSASLMFKYGRKLFTVRGSFSNIKITTPEDFYFARALFDMEEDVQLKKL